MGTVQGGPNAENSQGTPGQRTRPSLKPETQRAHTESGSGWNVKLGERREQSKRTTLREGGRSAQRTSRVSQSLTKIAEVRKFRINLTKYLYTVDKVGLSNF